MTKTNNSYSRSTSYPSSEASSQVPAEMLLSADAMERISNGLGDSEAHANNQTEFKNKTKTAL